VRSLRSLYLIRPQLMLNVSEPKEADVDPTHMRDEGAALLAPLLTAHGFEYIPGVVDRGSGGRFAQGAFVRDSRCLEFSTRHSLGDVVYRLGEHALPHVAFMRAVAPRGAARYPGFRSDPLDSFRDLAADIAAYGTAFLTGTNEAFLGIVDLAQQAPSGFAALDRRPAR